MSTIVALLVLQTLVPLLLLWWSVLPGPGSRVEWIAKVVMIGAYLVAIWIVGVWLVPSVYAPYAYFIVYAIYLPIAWVFVRRRPWRPAARIGRIRVAFFSIAAVLFVVIAVAGAAMRQAPDEPLVELDFPLRDGLYYIAGDGSGGLVDLPGARSAEHALDIVAIDHLGQRSKGLRSAQLDQYVVFGKPVIAPCDGVVKEAVDGLPDLAPPAADPAHPQGNHVVLECGSAEVLLAHLRSGSIAVKIGDAVKRGDPLAQVGNSGDTREPHLRIQARREGAADKLLDGAPLPIGFRGRQLVRGDRLEQ